MRVVETLESVAYLLEATSSPWRGHRLDLSAVAVTSDILELESAWAGGIADFGDPRAADAIRRLPEFRHYRKSLAREVKRSLGSSFKVYRAMTCDELLDWQDGNTPGHIATTTDPKVAKAWANFAAHKEDSPKAVAEISVRASWVLMRGKPEESELVFDGADISGHLVSRYSGECPDD